jgi:hypothetical protein
MTAKRDKAQVTADLVDVSAELAATLANAEALYARRLGLFKEGRGLAPPITQRALASLAGTTEEAVTQALRKDKLRAAHAAGDHADKRVGQCPECKAAARNGDT